MHNDSTAPVLDPDIRLNRLVIEIQEARRLLQDCEHAEAVDSLKFALSSLRIAIDDIEKEARNDR
jgi:hypothetical protein